MNPVHAVLGNNDLLKDIVLDAYLDPRDLFVLALVCRDISKVALDVLWRKVDDFRLVRLFPTDIVLFSGHKVSISVSRLPSRLDVFVQLAHYQFFSRPPVTQEQWSRFDVHSHRICTMSILYKPGDIAAQDFCTTMGFHPRLCYPLTRLTHLDWSSTSSCISHCFAFICPTLTSVIFYLRDSGGDDAVADILQAVRETCPSLREFDYQHGGPKSSCSSIRVEKNIAFLIHHCIHLQKVSVPASHILSASLDHLPSLSDLHFRSSFRDDLTQVESCAPPNPRHIPH